MKNLYIVFPQCEGSFHWLILSTHIKGAHKVELSNAGSNKSFIFKFIFLRLPFRVTFCSDTSPWCLQVTWGWDSTGKDSSLPLTLLPLDKMDAILADGNFKCIFLNENDWITIKISLKFVPRSPIDNKPALVQVMAWCQTGNKPLPELMLSQFTGH